MNNTADDTDLALMIIKQIKEINKLLKCSICSNTFNTPVTTKCRHTFCENCFMNSTSNQKRATCPLCRKSVAKKPHLKINELGSILSDVTNITTKITSAAQLDVFNDEEISKQLKDVKLNKISPQKTVVSNTKLNESANIKRKRSAPGVNKKILSKSDILFEDLVQPSTSKCKQPLRTYTHKRKVCDENEEEEDEEQNDSKNSDKVENWLKDDKNQFQRSSQTQLQLMSSLATTKTVDLTSISQGKGAVNNNSKCGSLQVQVKRKKGPLKRRTLPSYSPDVEESCIEEIYSDPKQQLEVAKPNEQNSTACDTQASSNWDRFKTIENINKVYKKLIVAKECQNQKNGEICQPPSEYSVNNVDRVDTLDAARKHESPKKDLANSCFELEINCTAKANCNLVEKAEKSTSPSFEDDGIFHSSTQVLDSTEYLRILIERVGGFATLYKNLKHKIRKEFDVRLDDQLLHGINEVFAQLEPYYEKLGKVLNGDEVDFTNSIEKCDQFVQTVNEMSYKEACVQTVNEYEEKSVQTEEEFVEKTPTHLRGSKFNLTPHSQSQSSVNKENSSQYLNQSREITNTSLVLIEATPTKSRKNDACLQSVSEYEDKLVETEEELKRKQLAVIANTPKHLRKSKFILTPHSQQSITPSSENNKENSSQLMNQPREMTNTMESLDLIEPTPTKSTKIVLKEQNSKVSDMEMTCLKTPKKPTLCKKLEFNNGDANKSKFKRIRTFSSDSDDETRLQVTKKAKNHLHIDDVSIHFDSETQHDRLSEILKPDNLSMDYLDEVWDKINNGTVGKEAKTPTNNPKVDKLHGIKATTSNHVDIVDNCDKVIEECTKKILQKEDSCSKKQVELKKVDQDVINQEILDALDEPFTCTDEINRNDQKSASPLSSDMLQALDEPFTAAVSDEAVIDTTLTHQIETTPKKAADNNKMHLSDDELFASDDEVIDSTPEKKPEINVAELFDINEVINLTFTPPPEFQDCVPLPLPPPQEPIIEIIDNSDKTVVQQSTQHALPDNQNKENLTFTDFSETISNLSPIRETQASFRKRLNGRPSSNVFLKRSASTPISKQSAITNFMRKKQNVDDAFGQLKRSLVQKPCIAGTRLTKDQLIAISALANKKLITYSTIFNASVTHMIVCTNENNRIKDHTIKFVSAVAAGIWVLNFKWIQECLAHNQIVSEEPYEVLDVTGIAGPKESRLHHKTNPLFKGFRIHAAPPFVSTTQQDVENVVRLLGGKVVANVDDLFVKNGDICLVVTESSLTQDFEFYESMFSIWYSKDSEKDTKETWLETLRVITVDLEWLSRSVAQYKIMNLRRFALCSDDTMNELNYPPELIADVSCSFTQTTLH